MKGEKTKFYFTNCILFLSGKIKLEKKKKVVILVDVVTQKSSRAHINARGQQTRDVRISILLLIIIFHIQTALFFIVNMTRRRLEKTKNYTTPPRYYRNITTRFQRRIKIFSSKVQRFSTYPYHRHQYDPPFFLFFFFLTEESTINRYYYFELVVLYGYNVLHLRRPANHLF